MSIMYTGFIVVVTGGHERTTLRLNTVLWGPRLSVLMKHWCIQHAQMRVPLRKLACLWTEVNVEFSLRLRD